MAEFYKKRKKVCPFCSNHPFDYKSDVIKKYIGESGRILPRRITGACLKHQKEISRQIKLARFIGLIPYVNK